MQTFEESSKEFQKWFKLAEATLPVQEYSSGMGWHARDVEIEALRAKLNTALAELRTARA
jgi:hypothetical protein